MEDMYDHFHLFLQGLDNPGFHVLPIVDYQEKEEVVEDVVQIQDSGEDDKDSTDDGDDFHPLPSLPLVSLQENEVNEIKVAPVDSATLEYWKTGTFFALKSMREHFKLNRTIDMYDGCPYESCKGGGGRVRDMISHIHKNHLKFKDHYCPVCHTNIVGGKRGFDWKSHSKICKVQGMEPHTFTIQEYAGELFSLSIMISEGYFLFPVTNLRLRGNRKAMIKGLRTFSHVFSRLPMELQMILCNYAWDIPRGTISWTLVRATIRRLGRFLLPSEEPSSKEKKEKKK